MEHPAHATRFARPGFLLALPMDVQNTAIYGDSAFAVTAPIHLVVLRCDRTGEVLDGTART